MGQVIPLIRPRDPAKSEGVFAQVNISARSRGLSNEDALSEALRARRQFDTSNKSAAGVVSDALARIRQSAPEHRA